MLYPTLTLNLVIFGGLPLLLNLASLVPLFRQKKGRTIWDNPSHLPVLCLLLIDVGLALLLSVPIYSFISEKPVFTTTTCYIYGAMDMSLSLSQVVTASIIAFDRYIATISPKWGKWRCHSNYWKLFLFLFVSASLWSVVPVFGYGNYDTFLDGHFCSLDWKQGDLGPGVPSTDATEQAHRYIAFLTATCLVFFLIPVCIASSFYYSIIDHVDRINSSDSREDAMTAAPTGCTWAPKNHVAKVGLGCLLVSTVPYLAYSVVCLNPLKTDFKIPSYVVLPVIISRFSALLNPILYILCNPEVVPIDAWLAKRLAKRRPPPRTYHTINLMMNVPGMSFPILTPTMPRRQLPQIPPHLVSPSKRPSHPSFFEERQPMLQNHD